MHQDIQNFSQIMDINDKLIISYKLIIHRNPIYKFIINNQEIENLEGTIILNENQDILFSCYESSGNSAIEIVNLTINGKEILKKYMHLANPPTHWIENCPKWELKIPKHFYAWYQEVTGQGDIF
jgi:hypothetical protein